MADNKPIEIKIDNKEVLTRLQELASRGENLRPLMKNIAGIMSTATEDNFKDEGRPEKWVDLSETTKKQRQKIGKYPGQILQVSGQLASSVSTAYDDNSAVIGSNLAYAAIHQLGGQAGKNKSVEIPARPYLKITNEDQQEIINLTVKYIEKIKKL